MGRWGLGDDSAVGRRAARAAGDGHGLGHSGRGRRKGAATEAVSCPSATHRLLIPPPASTRPLFILSLIYSDSGPAQPSPASPLDPPLSRLLGCCR